MTPDERTRAVAHAREAKELLALGGAVELADAALALAADLDAETKAHAATTDALHCSIEEFNAERARAVAVAVERDAAVAALREIKHALTQRWVDPGDKIADALHFATAALEVGAKP